MTLRALKNAPIARLEADEILTDVVFEGLVDTDEAPELYVSVFVNPGRRERSRFTGPSNQHTLTLTIHAVGTTPDQALLALERVRAQLIDWTPTVDGYNCRELTHEVAQPMRRDDDADPRLYYFADEYDLVADLI